MKLKHNFLIKNIVIASDHAGFSLKESIKKELKKRNFKILDLGTKNENKSVDYPIYAKKLAKKINSKNYGILVCGSGIGMSIASNRFKNVRSALANSINASKLSRQHNNANVICLGSRVTSKKIATQCVLSFLSTEFEGGRHSRRVKLLN
jgi:ribose 5-phosphate isomerase B|tara:strand:- start:362 stop:811 length:450 start_codon:yes stop_codon:yes gene_type:complete